MTSKRRKPKPKSKPCAGCAHYRSETGSRGGKEICHYILDTGEPRGCPPEECDKRVTQLQQKTGIEMPFNHEAYELRRAMRCGDKERAIFARGRINVLPTGETNFAIECKTRRYPKMKLKPGDHVRGTAGHDHMFTGPDLLEAVVLDTWEDGKVLIQIMKHET